MSRIGQDTRRLEQALESRDPPVKALAEEIHSIKEGLSNEARRVNEVDKALAKSKAHTEELFGILSRQLEALGAPSADSLRAPPEGPSTSGPDSAGVEGQREPKSVCVQSVRSLGGNGDAPADTTANAARSAFGTMYAVSMLRIETGWARRCSSLT